MSGKNKMQATPRQNLYAALLMVLLLATLGGRFWFDHQAGQILGVSLLSHNGEFLLAEINRRLYLMDRDGDLLDTISLDEFAIDGEIVDLQLLNRNEILLGDWNGHRLLRCNIRHRDCQPLKINPADRPRKVFKFHYDQPNRRLLLADNDRQVLLLIDEQGKSRRLSRAGQFRFPSQVRLTGRGRLQVTDTNHHRVAVFEFDGDTLADPVLELRAASGQFNNWPIAASPLPDGGWAGLFANALLGDAELLLFDRDGHFLRRVSIPGAGELRSLSRIDDVLLVGDVKIPRLYRVDAAAGSVSEFGNGQLKDRLQQLRTSKQRFSRLSNTLLVLLAGIVVLAFMLAIAVSRNREGVDSRNRSPRQRMFWQPARLFPAVVWISADSRAFASMKRLLLVAGGLIIFLDIMLLAVMQLSGSQAMPRFLLLATAGISALILLISVLFYLYFQNLGKYRIGSDGKYLYFMNPRRQALQIPPEEIVYSHHQLSYGPYTLLLYNPQNNAWFFPRQRFEDFIRPLLEQGTRLGQINMMIYQLRHRNRVQVISLLFLVALLVAMSLAI